MRIAIVDDHELVRQGLVSLLTHTSEPPAVVSYSGAEVNPAIASAPEVVLLDVDLGSDSEPVAANVHLCVSAGIPVLLISSNEDSLAIRSGVNAGALGFVPKRVSYQDLVEALQCVLRGEIFLSVDLAAILSASAGKPELSPRELDALRLYASGLTLNSVARRMEISPHTAKEYLDRVRAKYGNIGREARTRTELYVAANDDGLLDPYS